MNQRSVLDERHEEKKCTPTFAVSEFNSTVVAIIAYFQDKTGKTKAAGLIKSGLKPGHRYDVVITNDCGMILKNITSDLGFASALAGDGSGPFTGTLKDVNLNCDSNGVLNAYTPKPPAGSSNSSDSSSDYYYKDPCKTYYRKRDEGAETRIFEDGSSYAQAPILSL
ncbi:8914_t:CDS:1 [Gigaspora margarita]|uniref:8914_t:CDS:1 n=1 Tax=Gigaspora margarita TaxID=4874 RepID=A0ABN7WDY9_GIGMA|nr:8914_t:CDS:1 [Gigaspora margarita]